MSQRDNQDLIIATNPKSAFAEAIKATKTNILFSGVGSRRRSKIIAITSPEPGDGKSFVTSNLALAFASDGKRVLIIDGDLRRGRQHKIFGLKNHLQNGYSTLLLNYLPSNPPDESQTLIDDSIRYTDYPNVHLLPAGPIPPNPLELLSSKNNQKILKNLRSSYDIILIDCPPVLGLSDTLVLARLADINLITVTSRKTKLDQLAFVKKAYKKIGVNISGVIINKAKLKSSSYSYYSSDKYYSETTK